MGRTPEWDEGYEVGYLDGVNSHRQPVVVRGAIERNTVVIDEADFAQVPYCDDGTNQATVMVSIEDRPGPVTVSAVSLVGRSFRVRLFRNCVLEPDATLQFAPGCLPVGKLLTQR